MASSSETVSCERVVALLLEYLEGDLPPVLATAMEQHLDDCPHCLEFLGQYKATSALCREELAREMPKDLSDRLATFVRESVRPGA